MCEGGGVNLAPGLTDFSLFIVFYIHLESSYPRSKGDSVRFESPYVVPAYHCVSFQYHMWGKHVGRLNVHIDMVDKWANSPPVWRLSGDQGNSWNRGQVKLFRRYPFKVRTIVSQR